MTTVLMAAAVAAPWPRYDISGVEVLGSPDAVTTYTFVHLVESYHVDAKADRSESLHLKYQSFGLT